MRSVQGLGGDGAYRIAKHIDGNRGCNRHGENEADRSYENTDKFGREDFVVYDVEKSQRGVLNQKKKWERRAYIGDRKRIDEGAYMLAADSERASVDFAGRHIFSGSVEFLRAARFYYRDIVEHS